MSGDAHGLGTPLPAFGKCAAMSLLLLLCPVEQSVAQGEDEARPKFPRTYSTSWGQMAVQKGEGPDVSGSYPEDDGRISGTLVGTILSGYWIESGSDVECETSRAGSRFWGRMRMEFAADFRSFTGVWGYCDGEQHRQWAGSLEESTPVATALRFVQQDGFGFAPLDELTYSDTFLLEVDFDMAPEQAEHAATLEWDGGRRKVTVFRTADNPLVYRSGKITLRRPGFLDVKP